MNACPVDDGAIAAQMPLVRILAFQTKRRLPLQIDVDDLISVGCIGLMKAAHSFDATKGATFRTYAGIRINGALQDYIRTESGSKRRHPVRLEQLHVRRHERAYLPRLDQTVDVRRAMAKTLTPRERRILTGMSSEGHSGAALAAALHLCPTTVFTTYRAALRKLRAVL